MEPLRDDDPEMIGPYRLFALLGRGGWGSVYFARRPFGRGVALKTILPEHLAADPVGFRRRFAHEVEMVSAVDSPYTAQVVDADTQAARPWIAARYIRGVDLAEALDHCGTPLPQRTWRVLATGLADALRSIHAAELVHRDLKLANILLAGDGPYVIDFGIARNLAPDGITLTGSGVAPRTATFSSPEQLRDDPAGPASDVFALGVVLAYAGLNRHPFGPGSVAQIQSGILDGRHRLGGLSAVMKRIVLPCLDPVPENRPTPVELAGMLPPSVSPKEEEWLPPGLRSVIAGLSDLAVDLEEPMRERRPGPPPSDRPEPGRAAALVTTAPPRRPAEGGDLPPAVPARSVHEATTQPPPKGRPVAQDSPQAGQQAPPPSASVPVPVPAAAPAPVPASASAPKAGAASAPKAGAAKAAKGLPGARYRAAAEAGDPAAMREVAVAYRAVQDWPQALSWSLRAAEAGNPTGALEAALLIERRFPEASERLPALYRQAAGAGEIYAMMRLGALLEGSPGGLAEALDWYEQAAARHHQKAPEAVARVRAELDRLRKPEPAPEPTPEPASEPGPEPEDEDAALIRRHEGAAREGDVKSMLALASWHMGEKRAQEGLAWYRRAAEAGHVHAMVVTAQWLAKEPGKQAEAVGWFRRAAAAGSADGMFGLGRSLKHQGNVPVALLHFRQAAAQGHLFAMTEAAEILEGMGQRQEALEWYQRAAEKRHPKAAAEADRLRAELSAVDAAAPPPVSVKQAAKGAAVKPEPVKQTAKAAAGRAVPTPTEPDAGVRITPATLRAAAAAHERAGRPSDALQSLLRAERLGDLTVKRDIARLYLVLRDQHKRPVDRKPFQKQAVRKYAELAEAGDVEAMFTLVGLDTANSLAWRLRAAEAGSTRAMRDVARVQLKAGTEEHVEAALSWLTRAAEAGDTEAMLEGARLFERRGAYGDAVAWYRWAAENGVESGGKAAARVTAEHPVAVAGYRVTTRLERLRSWGRAIFE
ncbi:protein kinase [Kitasatospora sp. NPDC093550]|uniref:serine/threonine-protein kinase n=1 Tax=Kitasatospora sp. NPDC093550 TaxID=3364089 RepID=UPI0038189E35